MEPVILDGLIPMGLVQSPLGVVMFDAELRVVWVNEAAVRLSGGTPAGRWPGRRLGEVLPCMDADVIGRCGACWRPGIRWLAWRGAAASTTAALSVSGTPACSGSTGRTARP